MSYKETIDYLYNRLPMFSKQGASAIKKDLTNTIKLSEALGNPHQQFKSIHIAGTNGKGSTSHMLASILQKQGYKVGLYTSPHLLDFRERIRVNGEMIEREEVIAFVKENKALFEEVQPSFFEVTVIMAFAFFAKQKVDIAIIETGLGGRLDSTNIIHPLFSIITNVSLDHTNVLGNTLEDIAKEKAGIIKNNTPLIVSEEIDGVKEVLEKTANEKHSKVTFASRIHKLNIVKKERDFLYIEDCTPKNKPTKKIYKLDLTGNYQYKNLAGVLSAIDELIHLGYSISDSNINDALANVKSLTHLMGRWQILGDRPLIVCDTGHNQKGWEEILSNIEDVNYTNLHMVIGIMQDKDVNSLLTSLPAHAKYYFSSPKLERALSEIELKRQADQKGLKGDTYPSVLEAIKAAKENAKEDDFIFIGGSTFVVAEALDGLTNS